MWGVNWAAGFFRLWIVGAALWVVLIGSTMGLQAWESIGCPDAGPWCQYRSSPSEAFTAAAITALGYPLAFLAIGSALVWAVRGFRGNPP